MNSILYLLIGAYTYGASEGIYLYKFDQNTGNTEYVNVTQVDNVAYLEVGDGKHIYAVSENRRYPTYADAFYFDKEQEKLTLLNSQETFIGTPVYIAEDMARKVVLTANYAGGITVYRTDADTLLPAAQVLNFEGSGADTIRQKTPHLHCIQFSPEGKYVFALDLGTDLIYRFDIQDGNTDPYLKKETVKTFKVADKSGPRHMIFHPNNKYAYIINELSGSVIGFNYKNGELEEFQTIQADTIGGRSSADIVITPNGKFLYASNRNRGDGIAVFSINESNGHLTKSGYQPTARVPRSIQITPNGKYILAACTNGNAIEVYEINQTTGLLSKPGKDITTIETPVCLKFIE
ncbi:6-phosphogluconolactonase [Bacteroidia bacterium]|nr:6-phosphogluconolactonase [Bacteroidia bacterium]